MAGRIGRHSAPDPIERQLPHAPRVLAAAFVALALALTVLVPSSADAAAMPSKKKWVADTYKALNGSRIYVRDRVAEGGTKLGAQPRHRQHLAGDVLRHRQAGRGDAAAGEVRQEQGRLHPVQHRPQRKPRAKTIAGLKRAGYPVDGLCAHYKGEALRHSKQRCRQSFVNNGFTIIANIGNRSTDFVGGNYERAYRLPNYGNRLG